MKLRDFDLDNQICDKCGCGEVKIKFCKTYRNDDLEWSEQEHLIVICSVCGYEWKMKCLDDKGE